jgi:hypothetical protein
MERNTTPAWPLLLVVVLAAAGLGAFWILGPRRRGRGELEPGEEIAINPERAVIAEPEPVQLGTEDQPRQHKKREGDLSKRRRLPPGPYRAAPDEPATDPAEA